MRFQTFGVLAFLETYAVAVKLREAAHHHHHHSDAMFPYLKFTDEDYLNTQLSPLFGNAQLFSKPGDSTPALFGDKGLMKAMTSSEPLESFKPEPSKPAAAAQSQS